MTEVRRISQQEAEDIFQRYLDGRLTEAEQAKVDEYQRRVVAGVADNLEQVFNSKHPLLKMSFLFARNMTIAVAKLSTLFVAHPIATTSNIVTHYKYRNKFREYRSAQFTVPDIRVEETDE